MEKRNYVKPAIEFHGINPTTSFMIVSGAVPGGSIVIEGYKDIDQCIQINGAVSDQQLINIIKSSGGSYTGRIDQGNQSEGESCTNATLQEMCGYNGTVTILDEEKLLFQITFSDVKYNNCNTGGGRPGRH